MLKFEFSAEKLGYYTPVGQSWKRRWFRVGGADVNYLVKMNQECCGEFLLTKDTTVAIVKGGAATKENATSSGSTTLPDKPNIVELANVSWRGAARSFYISFDNPADQREFMHVVKNNVQHIADGA